MTTQTTPRQSRSRTKLNKRFVATHEGFDVYTVDASALRTLARADEEFGNFATQDEFPDLIPKGEIWLAEKNFDQEGLFFVADAVTRMKAKKAGVAEDTAYTAGLNVQRILRKKHLGVEYRGGQPHKRVPPDIYVEHYITLPDATFPVEVWLVCGHLVRSYYKTDYTEGGHGYVYPWVPKGQIWVEKDLDRWELPYIVSHEYLELRLMRDAKMEYDAAHEICSKVEFNLRKCKGAHQLLVRGHCRFTKKYVPRLTREEVFDYVRKTYLRK